MGKGCYSSLNDRKLLFFLAERAVLNSCIIPYLQLPVLANSCIRDPFYSISYILMDTYVRILYVGIYATLCNVTGTLSRRAFLSYILLYRHVRIFVCWYLCSLRGVCKAKFTLKWARASFVYIRHLDSNIVCFSSCYVICCLIRQADKRQTLYRPTLIGLCVNTTLPVLIY
jgi:hypothetical protein